jgi:hypothetical protein
MEKRGGELVTIVDEFGEDEDLTVILITPFLVASEWHHADDAVDYIEMSLQADANMDPRITYIPKNPFPYSGTMDSLTGQRIQNELVEYTDLARFVSEERLDELVRKDANSNYSSYAELKERMVPAVPAEAHAIVDYFNLLEPEGWKKLRPMVLTYWK